MVYCVMDFEVNLTEQAITFITSLPIKMQAKIQRTIELLEEFGYSLPEPHSKKLKDADNIYELRIKLGSDICRLFYFHWQNGIYIIISGYIKKSQKTDKREIEKAITIMKSFKEQNNG